MQLSITFTGSSNSNFVKIITFVNWLGHVYISFNAAFQTLTCNFPST